MGGAPQPTRAAPVYGYVDQSHARPEISERDIILWTSRGIRDDVIISKIEESATVFQLSGADTNHLRDKGVSESVIAAMRATARRG